MEDSPGYTMLRAPELRELCEERHLSTDGFKDDLVARLLEQDAAGDTPSRRAPDPPPSAAPPLSEQLAAAQAAVPALAMVGGEAEAEEELGLADELRPAAAEDGAPVGSEAAATDAGARGELEVASAAVATEEFKLSEEFELLPVAVREDSDDASEDSEDASSSSDIDDGVDDGAVEASDDEIVGTLVDGYEAIDGPDEVGEESLEAPTAPEMLTLPEVPPEAPALPDDGREQPAAAEAMPTVISEAPLEAALTDNERILRGLLQFHICEDARRPSSVEAPLRMKYRDLITVAYDSTCRDNTPRTVPGTAEGTTANVAELEKKEMLKRQLLAKQQRLAQEVERLRRQKQLREDRETQEREWEGSVIEIVPADEDEDAKSKEDEAQIIDADTHRSGAPPPPWPLAERPPGVWTAPPPKPGTQKRRRDHGPERAGRARPTKVSKVDRSSETRATETAAVAATVEIERLQARKQALEEVNKGLQVELGQLKEKRRRAAEVLEARRKEEATAIERFSAAVAAVGADMETSAGATNT